MKRQWIGLPVLIVFLLHVVHAGAETVLAYRAKVTLLATGFEDVLFANGAYFELYFQLDPDDSVISPCSGNHPAALDGVWVFSPGTPASPLRTRQLFSLLNTAWVANMPVSLVADSGESCAEAGISQVILHQRNP